MILDDKTNNKPEINYPTSWGFKVIGKDKDKIEKAIKEVMKDKKHKCKLSNVSKNGKFTSYNTECTVENEKERDNLYKLFGEHDDIDYVI